MQSFWLPISSQHSSTSAWVISIQEQFHNENATWDCPELWRLFFFLFGKTCNRTSRVFQLGDEVKSPNKGLRGKKIFQRSRWPRSVLIYISLPNPTVTSLFLFMFLSLRNSLPPHSLRLFTLPLRWWAPLCQFSFLLHTARAHKFILINSLGDKSCCRQRRRYCSKRSLAS